MASSSAERAGLQVAIPGELTDTAINLVIMGDLKSQHLDEKKLITETAGSCQAPVRRVPPLAHYMRALKFCVLADLHKLWNFWELYCFCRM